MEFPPGPGYAHNPLFYRLMKKLTEAFLPSEKRQKDIEASRKNHAIRPKYRHYPVQALLLFLHANVTLGIQWYF